MEQQDINIIDESSLLGYRDSLGEPMPSPVVVINPEVTLGELLGSHATTVQQHSSGVRNQAKEYFGISELSIILLAAALYSLCFYRYRVVAGEIIKSIFYPNIAQRLASGKDINVTIYTRISSWLIITFIAIFVYGTFAKGAELGVGYEMILPILFGTTLAYGLWRRIILLLIAYLGYDSSLRREVIFYDNLVKSAWMPLFGVLSLLTISDGQKSSIIVEYMGYITLCAMLLHQIITQNKIFKSKGLSFFQYILYLCSTELLPISFVTTIITRQLG